MAEPVVYLLHFERSYHHARHYVGIAQDGDANRRLREHLAGQGSPLVRAVVAAGIRVHLVLTAPGDRGLERRWHNRHGHGAALCPRCRGRRTHQLRLPIRIGGRRRAAPATPLWNLAAWSVKLKVDQEDQPAMYSYTCPASDCRISVEGLGYRRRNCHRCGSPVESIETASLWVVVNVQGAQCAACGSVHTFVSRDCRPIAWPAGFTPLGLPTQPAAPPAQVWPDIEAAALRYKVAISVN